MRTSVVALGIGIVGLVGFGVWLGRSASSPSSTEVRAATEPAPAEATPPQSPAATRARVPVAPALPARHVASSDPSLAADLRAADPQIRRAAVREVARTSDPDPSVMLAASRDADQEVAGVAMQALGPLYAAGQVPVKEMIARATDRTINERVRSRALDNLGAVENADAAGVLVDLLAKGDVLERRTAAAGLARQDMAIAVPALIRALGDADEYVRGNALEALKARSRGRDFGTDAGAWQAWWQSRPR
jgi:HEAT repeat protein